MLAPKQASETEEPGEGGQALIEFIMLIPLVMAFVWYLVHVNLAINKSIVGQQHARSQLFLKMYNHRSGPVMNDFGATSRAHFFVGVAGNVVVSGAGSNDAPTEILGIGPNPAKSPNAMDDVGEAPLGTYRQKVRIRNAFGICTHRKALVNEKTLTDFCGSMPEE